MSDTATPASAGPAPGARDGAPGSTRAFVTAEVARIQAGYLRYPQSSRSRADLARLRRGVGRDAGTVPEILSLTTNPDDARSIGHEGPTADEQAIHIALTLYAVHQQSQDRRMHEPGRRFGAALGAIRYVGGEESPGVVRRFQALGTATDLRELVAHARGLVTLLRSARQGFDYGLFARDLALLQDPAHADAVRLSWGRDFYRARPADADDADETTTGTTLKEQ